MTDGGGGGVVQRQLARWRQLVAERRALLRLLRIVPAPARWALGSVMVLANLLPAATAVAVAWLVARVIDAAADGGELSAVAGPLALVALLLTADQVTQSLIEPYRGWMAARVNGAIRRTVRQAVSVRPGVDHLESQVVRDAAALPVENAYLFNLGAGAEGQLWLMTRFAGALAAAAVVARASVPAAVAAFVFIAWQRSLLRRHYAGAIASGMVDTTGDGRAASYWSDVLSSAEGAKEVRLFGFQQWALDRFLAHGRRPVDELSRVLLGAHRLHLTIFALNALAAGVPFLLLAQQAIDGRLDAVAAHRRAGRGGRRAADAGVDGVGGLLDRGRGAPAGCGRAAAGPPPQRAGGPTRRPSPPPRRPAPPTTTRRPCRPSPSRACRSPTRATTRRCCATSTSCSSPAGRWPSWATTAPARRRC